MTTIIGVDFSGAEREGKTWIALGTLTEDGASHLNDAQRITRRVLGNLLAGISPPTVVGMDFPFGVPAAFAKYISTSAQSFEMPDVWRTVADMSKEAFIAKRNAFVSDNDKPEYAGDVGRKVGDRFCCRGEPKRYGDTWHHPESYSPLHKVNPNMVPMTYEGICLLHSCHQAHPQRWYVPPLDAPAELSGAVTLLEVMPGAFLKSIGLPSKGYKNGKWAIQLREEIIGGLAGKSGIALPNLDSVRMGCRANDDCLDAVVAAVCAAAWEYYRSGFHHPADGAELDYARREGWIYTFRSNFRPG